MRFVDITLIVGCARLLRPFTFVCLRQAEHLVKRLVPLPQQQVLTDQVIVGPEAESLRAMVVGRTALAQNIQNSRGALKRIIVCVANANAESISRQMPATQFIAMSRRLNQFEGRIAKLFELLLIIVGSGSPDA